MARKYEHISTGNGFWVENSGTKTQVISQAGNILTNIQDTLAQGSIYIGNSSNVTSELSVKTDTGFLVGNGTTAVVKTMSGEASMANTGAVTLSTTAVVGKALTGYSSTTGAISASDTIVGAISKLNGNMAVSNRLDDVAFTLGTTLTNAATNVSLEFDKTTTGIGQLKLGDTSNPQVLNTNPGASVIAHTINVLHSAGAGDCTDLVGSYSKVAIQGDGDADTTLVGSAPRAYVLAGTAKEVYGVQPWAKHVGTGTVTAMSATSSMLLLNDAEAFTATNSINSGHFHVSTVSGAANGTVTSSNFDGVMIEVYPNVTGLQSMLHLAQDGTTTITSAIKIGGADYTNAFEFGSEGDAVVVGSGTYSTADGYLVIKVGSSTYRIPFFTGTDEG
jgi:hypothetical protein